MAHSRSKAAVDNQLFQDVFHASPIGIVVENLEGQPLFVNPAFCAMLGFTEEEVRNRHCIDFSPTEDAQKDWALFQQLRAGAIDHYQLDKRYVRRDGSLVWGRLSLSLLKHYPSPLVLAMVEDITDKKKAEEARFRHAAVIESSDDAIATGTLDGTIVSWNTGAEKIYGYTEAEAVGKPIAMLVPPELPDEENKILETLRAGGRIEHFETVRITKMGKRINVSLCISPIKDSSGRTVGISGIARDITDRKRAQEALREGEERLRLAVQAGKMFAYSWDAATDVIEHSGESVDILGIDKDQTLTGAAMCAMAHSDDRGRVEAALWELSVQTPTLQISYRIIRPDGTVLCVEQHVRASFDNDNKLNHMVGMITDVTDRTRGEQEINRKLIEAQEKERARIGRELHDDINQRLAMLSVELEQLDQNPSELHSHVPEIRKELRQLSDDVQALSHDLHSSKLEYLGAVATMRSWCQEFAERQNMEIDFKSSVSSTPSLEVGLALFRVLQEALQNASKHSGVRRVAVQVREDSGEILLLVHDSGKGFDVEIAMQGKGLGLTSMRERVRLVNGTIAIDSQRTTGTTIHVRVPLRSQTFSERLAS